MLKVKPLLAVARRPDVARTRRIAAVLRDRPLAGILEVELVRLHWCCGGLPFLCECAIFTPLTVSSSRSGRDSVVPYLLAAAAGAGVGYLLGDHVRMTVPHGCRTGCGPDYGISGATAGAVWGALIAIAVASWPRGWKPRIGAIGVLLTLLLFTVLEPK